MTTLHNCLELSEFFKRKMIFITIFRSRTIFVIGKKLMKMHLSAVQLYANGLGVVHNK